MSRKLQNKQNLSIKMRKPSINQSLKQIQSYKDIVPGFSLFSAK